MPTKQYANAGQSSSDTSSVTSYDASDSDSENSNSEDLNQAQLNGIKSGLSRQQVMVPNFGAHTLSGIFCLMDISPTPIDFLTAYRNLEGLTEKQVDAITIYGLSRERVEGRSDESVNLAIDAVYLLSLQKQIDVIRNKMQEHVDNIVYGSSNHGRATAGLSSINNNILFRNASKIFRDDKTWNSIFELRKMRIDTEPETLFDFEKEGVSIPTSDTVILAMEDFIYDRLQTVQIDREDAGAGVATDTATVAVRAVRVPMKPEEAVLRILPKSGQSGVVAISPLDILSHFYFGMALDNFVASKDCVKDMALTMLLHRVVTHTGSDEDVKGKIATLVNAGVNLNSTIHDASAISGEGGCFEIGVTALYLAVKYNNLEAIEALIEHGANLNPELTLYYPNGSRTKGRTPLYEAAEFGFWDAFTILAAAGADINAKITFIDKENVASNKHKTALHQSVCKDDLQMLTSLLAAGVNLDASMTCINKEGGKEEGLTTLHFAAEMNQPDMVQILAREGADLSAVVTRTDAKTGLETKNITALHLAAENNSIDVLQALVNYNPSLVNMADSNGKAPMWYAIDANQDVLARRNGIDSDDGESAAKFEVATDVIKTSMLAGARIPADSAGDSHVTKQALGVLRNTMAKVITNGEEKSRSVLLQEEEYAFQEMISRNTMQGPISLGLLARRRARGNGGFQEL